MGLRIGITKSRAGHYTVCVYDGPGPHKCLYHRACITSLSAAREDARAAVARIRAARADT